MWCAAYMRSDLFEGRRLMDDWAAYLVGGRRKHSPAGSGGPRKPVSEAPAGLAPDPLLAGSRHTLRGHKEADEGLCPLDPQEAPR